MSAYNRLCEVLFKDYGLTPEQALAHDNAGELFSSICRGINKFPLIEISEFKDRRYTLYYRSGYKVTDRLLEWKSQQGGIIVSVLAELGDKSIHSLTTKETALAIQAMAFPEDVPLRGKIEKAATLRNLTHVHWIVWVKRLRDIKKIIKTSGETYRLKVITLGSIEKWNEKGYSYSEQVMRFTRYLYKCGIAATSPWNTDEESREQVYLEWFQDKYALHKLTHAEHSIKLANRPKLSWNRNINTKTGSRMTDKNDITYKTGVMECK